MKALIVEDEKLSADRLTKLVNNLNLIEILETCYSVKSANNWLSQNKTPDLLFLDIQLGDGTGFDVLDSIDSFPHIIFTTAFDQYILDAFKYNSIDYLLKPINPDRLQQAIEKLKKVKNNQGNFELVIDTLKNQLQKNYKKKFLVKIGLKYQSVSIKDVAYFYSEESSTFMKTLNDTSLIIDHSLDDLQSLVDPEEFFRINRHMFIHHESISTIDSYFNNRLILRLSPNYNQQVIVSREKVRAFKDWLDQ